MKENGYGRCVKPFIRRVQYDLENGGTLGSVLREIKTFQRRTKHVEQVDPIVKVAHAAALSSLGLGVIVVWECARSRGINLPDAMLLAGAIPLASVGGEEEFTNSNGDGMQRLTRRAERDAANLNTYTRAGGDDWGTHTKSNSRYPRDGRRSRTPTSRGGGRCGSARTNDYIRASRDNGEY